MEHNKSNEMIRKGSSAFVSIVKVASKVLSLFFSSTTLLTFGLTIFVTLLLPASLLSMFSSYTNGSGNVESFMDEKCAVNLTTTQDILEDYYYDETIAADKYIKQYVKEKHGVDLVEGNLSDEADILGQWNYAGWEEESMITVKFSHNFTESSQAVISYLEAIYTAHNYIDEVYFLKDECGTDCKLAEMESLSEQKQYDINDYLEVLKQYKENLFYVNEGIDWSDDLHMATWTVQELQVKGCSVQIPDVKEEDKGEMIRTKPIEIPICEEAVGKDYWFVDDLENKVRTYLWEELVPVEREGLVGTITIPVYFDAEALMKNERLQLISRMTSDLEMSETEAFKEYFDYVNGIFDTTNMLCGYNTNSRLFGSSALVGVGSLGFIGEISTPVFYEGYRYDTSKGLHDSRQLFDQEAIRNIWGRAFHLQTQGLIKGAYHSPQCTTLAHLMFYDHYGFDCGAGNGIDMAANTVALLPDKFVKSTSPAPGAIMSTLSYNHVGFVHAVYDDDVDGSWDRIMISDGNVMGGGLRIMAEYTPEQFYSVFGYSQLFAVPIN